MADCSDRMVTTNNIARLARLRSDMQVWRSIGLTCKCVRRLCCVFFFFFFFFFLQLSFRELPCSLLHLQRLSRGGWHKKVALGHVGRRRASVHTYRRKEVEYFEITDQVPVSTFQGEDGFGKTVVGRTDLHTKAVPSKFEWTRVSPLKHKNTNSTRYHS